MPCKFNTKPVIVMEYDRSKVYAGNPWIFKQIVDKFNNNEVKMPNSWEKVDMCIRHYNLALKYNERV